MKNLFLSFILSAACLLVAGCEDKTTTPIVEEKPLASVKTGAITADENEVTLEGTYAYEGTGAVSAGFRYAKNETELLLAEIIPAEIVENRAFFVTIPNFANGEYYYQAVIEVESQKFTGKSGWFSQSFSAIPEITTEAAAITDDGITLKGSFVFASTKIPIQLGFIVADTENGLSTASFVPAVVSGNSFSLTRPSGSYYYQAVAIVNEVQYKGAAFYATSLFDLSAAGAANTYVVPQAGKYVFDTKRPDGTVVVGTKADWAWACAEPYEAGSVGNEHVISDIKYENGKIMFTASGLKGNEMIVLLDANNKIQWNWLVWSTDQPQEQTFDGTTMLDRNLGATNANAFTLPSLGLYYQWGRKEPFPTANIIQKTDTSNYEDPTAFLISGGNRAWTANYVYNDTFLSTGFVTKTGYTTHEELNSNPLTHYGNYNNNFYAVSGGTTAAPNSQIEDFWGGVSGRKTNSDPCPAGYMVPTFSVLSGYIIGVINAPGVSIANDTNSGGRIATLNGVEYNFSAAAFRAWSGKVRYPGYITFWWSSNVSVNNGFSKRFYNFSSSEPNQDATSACMAVRCVKID